MDSLTQIVLGAAVGELTLGKKIGNKAQLIGAIAGTVPDLDVFLSPFYHDDLAFLTIHRAYSHALFIHIFLAIPFTWLTYRIFRRKVDFLSWYLLWFLGFSTHALLDCCTTYGTQLFLPFSNQQVAINNISVVDPLYTLPFLILLAICLFLPKGSQGRVRMGKLAIFVSSLYMCITFVNKTKADNAFRETFRNQRVQIDGFSSSPTMFNSVLWAGMGYNDTTIYVGEFSVARKNDTVQLHAFKRNLYLEDQYASPALETLKWFSNGFYFLEKGENDTLEFYNIKWGRSDFNAVSADSTFLFYYKLYPTPEGIKAKAVGPEFGSGDIKKALDMIWNRMF